MRGTNTMLRRKAYPKELNIGGEVYSIKFVKKLDKNVLAECDPGDKVIHILQGQSREDTLKCLIHELLHAAVEFEGDIELNHSLIYKLEEPIYKFLVDNCL